MKKLILLLALVVGLGGCAPVIWKHNSHNSQAQFEKDQRECKYDSVKYGQAAGYYATGVGAGIADGLRQNEIFMECMKARGYYTVSKKEVENQNPTPVPEGEGAADLADGIVK